MRTNTFFTIILFIILNSCSSNTEPDNSEKLIITDNIDFSYEKDVLDTLKVLDIDFSFDYHFKGSNGQIVEYFYYIKNIDTKFSSGNGWRLQYDRSPRGRTLNFSEENILNTLRYSKLLNLADQDTFYKVFEFKLKGFYCDSVFWNSVDTLNLESFEYSFIDTMLVIP